MGKQLGFIPKPKSKREHGGSLAVGKRRSLRPINIKQSHHITMKSYHAIGVRSLLKHKKMILRVIHKNSAYFRVRVYETAINGNHLHLLVIAYTREDLQNFFRVVAGHIAQRILMDFPLPPSQAGGAPAGQNKITKKAGTLRAGPAQPCLKNQRKFWSYLLYSRIVTWGREFRTVTRYIQRNTLEALQLIAYQPRNRQIIKINTS